MKYGRVAAGMMWLLICAAPASDRQGTAGDTEKSDSGTIIVYRQWSFAASAVPNWKFTVDNGPDLIVRNGTYLRVTVPAGDHILDHNHMPFWCSDPQKVHVGAGETIYFQYVMAMALVFEVADNQAQAARTVSKMRSVQEALDHSKRSPAPPSR